MCIVYLYLCIFVKLPCCAGGCTTDTFAHNHTWSPFCRWQRTFEWFDRAAIIEKGPDAFCLVLSFIYTSKTRCYVWLILWYTFVLEILKFKKKQKNKQISPVNHYRVLREGGTYISPSAVLIIIIHFVLCDDFKKITPLWSIVTPLSDGLGSDERVSHLQYIFYNFLRYVYTAQRQKLSFFASINIYTKRRNASTYTQLLLMITFLLRGLSEESAHQSQACLQKRKRKKKKEKKEEIEEERKKNYCPITSSFMKTKSPLI